MRAEEEAGPNGPTSGWRVYLIWEQERTATTAVLPLPEGDEPCSIFTLRQVVDCFPPDALSSRCFRVCVYPHSSSDEQSMRDAIGNADTVVNLIGKHYETKHLCFTRKEDGAINRVNSSFKNVRKILEHTPFDCGIISNGWSFSDCTYVFLKSMLLVLYSNCNTFGWTSGVLLLAI